MSTKTIAEKLLVKPGTALWLSDQGRLGLIGPLPQGVRVVETLEEATTAILFGDDATSLRAMVAAQAADLGEPDTVWVAYPKANRTDINRDSAWPILAEYGMRPIGQVAIDDVWSALRFRPLKPGEEPFKGGAAS